MHLRKIEWHLGHVPGIPPTLDQRFHAGCVDPAVPAVAGSLTPDGPADGIRDDGSNLAIEELGGATPHAGNPGKLGTLGHFAPGLRGVACFILPCLEVGVVFHKGISALLGQWIRIEHQVGVLFQLRMGLDRLALGESLDAGVAVGAEQDTDRYVQFLVEFMGEG